MTHFKNIARKITYFCIAISLTTASCNKFLDIQPEGKLPADKLLKDAKGFENALYGAYATLPKETLYGGNLSHTTMELLAQSFTVAVGELYSFNIQQYNYQYTDVERSLFSIWKDMYNNISNVNNVIKNLDKFSPDAMRYYNLYKGEALGLRAYMHFDLLRMFAERGNTGAGIPYSKDFSQIPPQFSTTAEVYDLIIADLKEAETLLADDAKYFTFPKVNPSDNYIKDREIHFNLYAVQATLARVYFTQGDMPNALIYAEKVIRSGKFELMDKAEIASGQMRGVLYPKEAIFGLYSKDYFSTVKTRYYEDVTRFSYTPIKNMKAIYDKDKIGNDYRWDALFKLPSVSGGAIRFVKLVDQYQIEDREWLRPAGLISGINMIRLPEMYYIAAEALLPTNADKAREYFDLVLTSRGLTGLKNRTPAVALTTKLLTEERYKEYIGEGQNFFNMKRLNLDIVDVNQKTIPASKAVYVFPIPVEETDYRK